MEFDELKHELKQWAKECILTLIVFGICALTIIFFTFFYLFISNKEVDNQAVGQVQTVKNVTPILCPDYKEVDLSLGVMKNGVGSFSKKDMTFYVTNNESIATAQSAQASGRLVRVTYNTPRIVICKAPYTATKIETLL